VTSPPAGRRWPRDRVSIWFPAAQCRACI